MKHIDHIGIAVKDMDESVFLFEKLLNTKCYKKEIVDGQNIITAFLKAGETKIELLQDVAIPGIISRFIEKRGEAIHHIAFEVGNIKKEVKRLKKEGFTFLNETPVKGADNKWVCFLYPKSTNSILVELCEQVKSSE